jgi:hypothetical protein
LVLPFDPNLCIFGRAAIYAFYVRFNCGLLPERGADQNKPSAENDGNET